MLEGARMRVISADRAATALAVCGSDKYVARSRQAFQLSAWGWEAFYQGGE